MQKLVDMSIGTKAKLAGPCSAFQRNALLFKLMLGVAFFFLFFWGNSTPFPAYPCVSYTHDFNVSIGYLYSFTNIPCGTGAPSDVTSSYELLHPGLIIHQESGKMLVVVALEGSPAAQSGIMPGDEILRINSRPPVAHTFARQPWENSNSPGTTDLLIKHSDQYRVVTVPLIPLRNLIDELWVGASSGKNSKNHSFKLLSFESPASRRHFYSTYTFGIELISNRDHLVVTDLLKGAPGYGAGLKVGDRIIGIDNLPIIGVNPPTAFKILSPEGRVNLELTVLKGKQRIVVDMTAESLQNVLLNSGSLIEGQNRQYSLRKAQHGFVR